MATHVAEIKWTAKESGEEFLKGRFSRAHIVSFDGGTEVPASASPHVVGKWAVEAAVDPEEMLVASLSSCHMLSFRSGADGRLHRHDLRRPRRGNDSRNRARPTGGDQGEASTENRVGERRAFEEELDRLHHEAHEICFIANSVKTQVTGVEEPKLLRHGRGHAMKTPARAAPMARRDGRPSDAQWWVARRLANCPADGLDRPPNCRLTIARGRARPQAMAWEPSRNSCQLVVYGAAPRPDHPPKGGGRPLAANH